MRIDLGIPIETQRAAAVKRITAIARDLHRMEEDAGGLDMVHALDIHEIEGHPDRGIASRSIARHRSIQDARRQAISSIGQAPHGAAIAAIINAFEQETQP